MTEPIHVTFARVCLGWGEVHSIGPRQHGGPGHVPGEESWVGATHGKVGYQHVPRVDRAPFDLGPWEEANMLNISHEHTTGGRPYVNVFNHIDARQSLIRREAVLRCLIALGEAGKLVRP
jgi:hypothetical protein